MKRLQINHAFLIGCLSLAMLLVPVHLAYSAEVIIYDNMTGYNPTWYAFDAASWYLYVGGYIEQQRLAQPFSTDDFSGTLSSVALLLNSYPGGNASVAIYADNGGKPGALLGRLGGISGQYGTTCQSGYPSYNNCTFGRVLFVPWIIYGGSTISLAPNTTYWVVLAIEGSQFAYYSAPCGGEVFWASISNSSSMRSLYSQDDGAHWNIGGSAFIQSLQVYGDTGPTTPQPIANAGADATAHEGSIVNLDGGGSSDPSGLSLTYSWEFVSVPPGSSAALSGSTAASPTFTVDQLGDYVVRLVVTNSEGVVSAPATVTISTYNTAPVADPGQAQAIVQVGTTVHLDGAQSYDVDGDPITYSWTFMSKPVSSAADLDGCLSATPTFVADVQGTYVIQLVASDPWLASTPKTVTVSFDNVKPVANAGAGQLVIVGDLVTVNGSGSSDANFDPLTYQWSFATMPPNSLAILANPAGAQATFVPDQPGTYGLQLIVNDGLINSDPSTVQIQATAALGDPLSKLVSDVITLIGSLDSLVFRNSNLQNSLINKLQAVLSAIQSGDYEDAVRKLQADLVAKTDGCAVAGVPDKNDWIVTCDSQLEVYTNLMKIIIGIMK